ncbi:MAG: POTRA domain-containing protein [candidate division WOR-3 bacterium]
MIFIILWASQEIGKSSFEEDNRFKVGEIILEGDIIFSEEKIKSLLPKKGEKFNEELFNKGIEKVIDFYSEGGFPFVKVTPMEFFLDGEYINCRLLIEAGYLERIREVFLIGLSYTKPEVFRNKISIASGELFKEEEIRRKIYKLEDLGYVEIDSFKIVPFVNKGWIDLFIFLREKREQNFEGIVSYSGNGGFSGLLGFRNKNLWGSGRTVDLELKKEGEKYQNELLKYIEPGIFSFPVDFCFSLSHDYIKDFYNLISFEGGIQYPYREVSFLIQSGVELVSTKDTSYSFLFGETNISYNSKLFYTYYRERFRKSGGWDLEILSDFYFLSFILRFKYFKVCLLEGIHTYFGSFRGYPGMPLKEGAVIGLEYINKLGRIAFYPFIDANFFEERWQYSYGFGIKIRKFSLEYGVPFEAPFSDGRVYFKFKER